MNKKIVYAISLIFAFNNISALPIQNRQTAVFTPEGPISHYTYENSEIYNAMGMWNGTRVIMTASDRSGRIMATFHPINGQILEGLNMGTAAAVFQQLKSAYAAQQNK